MEKGGYVWSTEEVGKEDEQKILGPAAAKAGNDCYFDPETRT